MFISLEKETEMYILNTHLWCNLYMSKCINIYFVSFSFGEYVKLNVEVSKVFPPFWAVVEKLSRRLYRIFSDLDKVWLPEILLAGFGQVKSRVSQEVLRKWIPQLWKEVSSFQPPCRRTTQGKMCLSSAGLSNPPERAAKGGANGASCRLPIVHSFPPGRLCTKVTQEDTSRSLAL